MPEVVPQAQAAPAAPVAPEKPVSIRDTVKAAFEKDAKAAPVVEAPKVESPKIEPPKVEAEPPKEPPKTEPPKAEPPKAEPEIKAHKMPVGWKAGADKWHQLDPVAKDFIARREKEVEQGIQRYAQAAQVGNMLMQEFMPYEAMLRSLGASPLDATRFLLTGYYKLRAGTPAERAQVIHALAAEAGVDLGSIQESPQVDPNFAALQEQIRQLQGYLQQQQRSSVTSEQSSIVSQIDAFAADPAHEHFETVRPMMAAILSSGQAKDLQGAYDLACWANPEIRASLVNQQFAQDAEKRKKQAEEAQRAAISINGAPPAPAVDSGDLSIRALVARGFANANRV